MIKIEIGEIENIRNSSDTKEVAQAIRDLGDPIENQDLWITDREVGTKVGADGIVEASLTIRFVIPKSRLIERYHKNDK